MCDFDCLHFAQYIQLLHMVLTVNKHDVRRFIACIESADRNPWYTDIYKFPHTFDCKE